MMGKSSITENMDDTGKCENKGATQDFIREVLSNALSKAYLHPEMVIADVITRAGVQSADLAMSIKQVHLLGRSPALMEAVRGQLSSMDNIEFRQFDGLDLPLAECSVDGVFCDIDLRNSPDPADVIQKLVRVIRPGGRLVFIVINTDSSDMPGFEEAVPEPACGPDRLDKIRPERIIAWLHEAGLVNVIMDCGDQAGMMDTKDSDDESGTNHFYIAVGTRRVFARKAVQNRYEVRAQESNCCCGDDSCCPPDIVAQEDLDIVHWDAGYSAAELAEIPNEAAEFSLGCGNPLVLASLHPGETVLDIGSGGGIDVFLAARQVGEKGFVYGVDMTEAMLERARKTAHKHGITNVEFRAGYAEALPFEDECVDVIISNCVINLSPDKQQVFNEAFRVLRPGGKFAVSDIVTNGSIPEELSDSLASWAGCVAGAIAISDYMGMMKMAGFVDISYQPVYFDEAIINEAVRTALPDLAEYPGEEIQQAVFSARISARKPL